IPALALPTEDTLNLRLNVPPSFRDPKSVVVVALPPISAPKPPPLHPVNPEAEYCAEKPGLVLSAEGAPVVFSTQLAYNLSLRVESQSSGKTTSLELPVKADASAGGLVLVSPPPPLPRGALTAVLHGKWGFVDWEGPHFLLQVAQSGKWTLAPGQLSALVVGREDTLHLDDDSTVCVDHVDEQVGTHSPIKLTWKSSKAETLEIAVPLKEANPGPLTLEVYQYGLAKPDKLPLTAYAEAASLDRLTLNAGDQSASLRGNRLDEVAKAELGDIVLKPAKLSRVDDFDRLTMSTDGSTAGMEPGKAYEAKVQLQDGRQLKVPVTVEPPRPQITLLNKGVQDDPSAAPSPVHLASADDLPVDGRLVFFLKSRVPADFPRDEKVELAAVDGSFHTLLSLSDGLMLEDSKTAMVSLGPLARFGASAFGPVQVRAMSAAGVTGDWLPLGTLVRIPGFKELRCPRSVAKPCTLTGANLFLASSVAATSDFSNGTDVPPDFTGIQLTVPRPAGGLLYLRLRDDPATVQTLILPVTLVRDSGAQAVPGLAAPAAAPVEKTEPKAATGSAQNTLATPNK
ncbi:MAG: hypothetical protein ABSF53_18300, partial [Terracidiphilus sp.]